MRVLSLTDEELVELAELNWNAGDLEKELAKRLSNKIISSENCNNVDACMVNKVEQKVKSVPINRWLFNQLNTLASDLGLMQSNDKTNISQRSFNKIIDLMHELEEEVKRTFYETIKVTNSYDDCPDVICEGINPVFANYRDVSDTMTFEQYFHKNLNPDIAPPGFLECVDSWIQISRKRPLVIYTTGDSQELNYCATLKEYLDTQ